MQLSFYWKLRQKKMQRGDWSTVAQFEEATQDLPMEGYEWLRVSMPEW